MPKSKNTKLSVFKGREAKLNRAIFQSLALKGPQTIYSIHRNVRSFKGLKYSHYANVNKRVRALHQLSYLRQANIQNTRAGFETVVYELTGKAFLALLLALVDLEEIHDRIDETSAMEMMATITDLHFESENLGH